MTGTLNSRPNSAKSDLRQKLPHIATWQCTRLTCPAASRPPKRINAPPAAVSRRRILPSTCGNSNGELTITGVTGGTAPYTYSVDGVNFRTELAFTGLPAGQHTLTVKDANGCTYAAFVTITNIAGPTELAASSIPATCADSAN